MHAIKLYKGIILELLYKHKYYTGNYNLYLFYIFFI